MAEPTKDYGKYTSTERMIMVLSLSLFGAMSYAYLTDVSIRKLLFKTATEDSFLSTPIGKIISMTGSLSRQRAGEFEFTGISMKDPLYPNDTLITSADSSAVIVLDSGEKFELGANSLVKLAFDFDFSAQGLTRKPSVQIVPVSSIKTVLAPRIVVRQAPQVIQAVVAPPPPPKQIVQEVRLAQVNPRAGERYTMTSQEYTKGYKSVSVNYSVQRDPNAEVPKNLKLYLLHEGNQVEKKPIAIANNQILSTISLKKPGQYFLEVRQVLDPEKSAAEVTVLRNSFHVNRDIELIDILATENSNNILKDAATRKNFEGMKLKWKPKVDLNGLGDYLVRIYSPEQVGTPAYERETSDTNLILIDDKIVNESGNAWSYSVERRLKEGFTAISGKQRIKFDFLSPKLISPQQEGIVSSEALATAHNLVFFSWTKTNYTSGYYFELSTDPSFTAVTAKKKTKDNLLSIPGLNFGTYYWRVTSYNSRQTSPPSTVFTFKIQ